MAGLRRVTLRQPSVAVPAKLPAVRPSVTAFVGPRSLQGAAAPAARPGPRAGATLGRRLLPHCCAGWVPTPGSCLSAGIGQYPPARAACKLCGHQLHARLHASLAGPHYLHVGSCAGVPAPAQLGPFSSPPTCTEHLSRLLSLQATIWTRKRCCRPCHPACRWLPPPRCWRR